MSIAATSLALVCTVTCAAGYAQGDRHVKRSGQIAAASIMYQALAGVRQSEQPPMQPPADQAPRFEPAVSGPSFPTSFPSKQDRLQALTVSVDGSHDWRNYGSNSTEALEKSYRERTEAWEENAIRTIAKTLVPFVERYQDTVSLTTKGMKMQFSKGWSCKLGFKPSLELSYKFK
jgi:hypothetical protein